MRAVEEDAPPPPLSPPEEKRFFFRRLRWGRAILICALAWGIWWVITIFVLAAFLTVCFRCPPLEFQQGI